MLHRIVLFKAVRAPPPGTEAIMLAHGFSIDLMADLIDAGLATAQAERMHAGSRPIEVTRVRSPRRDGSSS